MKKTLLPVFLMFGLGLLPIHSNGWGQAQSNNNQAQAFSLKLLDGGDFKSSELKGKVAVIKFVASY